MKGIQKFIFILCCLGVSSSLFAQIAGNSTASFLNLTPSARTAGLGSYFISVNDDDINVAINTPSLINKNMNNVVALNFVNHFSGTNYGSIAYGKTFEKLGSFVFNFQYINYGKFESFDENENSQGTFYAADYLLSIGWGRNLNDNFTIGANFKPILSQYEQYTAFAVAFDLAASYTSNNELFSVTAMGRNIGAQLVTFNGESESLPFELSIGLSYKLENAPFRIYFTATELQKWNLRYEDPQNPTFETDPFTGTVTKESAFVGALDNLARHAVIGIEFCPSKAFHIRLGYNYRQMKEMQAATGFNFSGFSYGVGIRVKKFYISYSRNNYHQNQAPNFISISTDLNRFFK